MRRFLKWGAIGFGGLLVVLLVAGMIISIFDSGSDVSREETASDPILAPSPTVALKSTNTPTPTLSRVCMEPMDAELTTLILEMQSCRPALSHETKETIRLFMELWSFKDDPEFHRVGFGACCKFNEWKQEVETLTNSAGTITVGEIGIVPGDLISLGRDYFQNAGQSTALTLRLEADLRTSARETMGLAVALPTTIAVQSVDDEIIGTWEMEYPGLGKAQIVIASEGGELRVATTFWDGSNLTQLLIEDTSSAERRFDIVDSAGEYLVINREGTYRSGMDTG